MKKAVLYTIISINFTGSTLCAESWYSPYLQKIRSYFNPTTLGYATVGAAAGGYVAHRADLNPCVGAACSLLLGLSAGKLKDIYANYDKSEQTQITPPSSNIANITSPSVIQTIPNPQKQYTPSTGTQTKNDNQENVIPGIKNQEKFNTDYQTIRDAVFARFSGTNYENDFKQKYQQPTVEALIELASHFDAIPIWSETWPVSATISIDGKEIALTGDIANTIYNNQKAINKLRNSYLE